MSARVFEGDCLDVMANMPDNHFDAIVTDPPYELGFMGKNWDASGVAFCPETWRAVFNVMKPGAHLVAFGAPKNYHRLACAIEDAGFEIRDSLMWVFGSGFPKSLDVSKAIDKLAGAEREIVGVRTYAGGHVQRSNDDKLSPPIGTFVRAQDDRIETAPATDEAKQWEGWGTALKPAYEPIVLARKPLSEGTVAANVLRWGTGAINIDATRVAVSAVDMSKGRWPANLCHDGSQGVLDLFPYTKSGTKSPDHVRTTSKTKNAYGERKAPSEYFPGDEGSAARFFYCSKASKQDRAGSKHPTVKPINLMRWLIRMVTPPNGIILDPFGGSGTTGEAAMCEGISAILIEREAEYISDIKRRIEAAE